MAENREHAPSWYAATAPVGAPRAPLQGDIEADVCIVGGGFTGLNAAIELRQRGFSVVLLEGRRIGWGASGRNGGQLIVGIGGEDKIGEELGRTAGDIAWRMGFEAVDIVRQRIEQHGIDCELKWGHLSAALRPRQLAGLAAQAEALARHGYPHPLRLVQAGEMQQFVASRRYIGGLYSEGSGHLHPLKLCLGEAHLAEQLGARLFEQSAASRIESGPHPRVHTAQGQVRAGAVLLACNAYLGGLYRPLRGRVLPAGSYLVATAPLTEAHAQALLPKDSAVADENTVLDYFRLSPDRRLLFGGLCNYSGRQPRDIGAALRPALARVFPQIAHIPFDYQWGGDIGISLRRIPQVGRLPGNVWYAMGYSGHGLGTTHLAARLVAEAMAGSAERFDVLARVKHRAMPGGRWLANPALALGMLFYRIRDALG